MQVEERAHGDDEAHPIDEDFLTALEYGMLLQAASASALIVSSCS